MNKPSAGMGTVGFIGLGAMGSRMARRLLDAGYPLNVYNRTRVKATEFSEHGARVWDTPRELARHSDTILVSVSDDAADSEALLGNDGALSGARPGSLILDLSSVLPETSRQIAAGAAERGLAMLDAPVSGSTPQAEAGSLTVFVGGEPGAYARARPLLEHLGSAIFHLGPNGAGSTMKLVVNALLGVGMQALAEAIALGERAGLDRNQLLSTLAQTAVVAPGQKAKLENALADAYPVEFALRLMWKDLGNVLRLAHEQAVPMPATAAAHEAYTVAQAQGTEEDFSAVIRTAEEAAGIQVGATQPDGHLR
jgi:3-hydroxyisobutyrate dehydrogenase